MESPKSYEELQEENRNLKKRLKVYKKKLKMYDEGFRLSDEILLGQEEENREVLKETLETTEPPYNYSLKELKTLFSKDFLEKIEEVSKILQPLFEREESVEMTTAKIKEHSQKYWGEVKPSLEEKELLKKTALFFSIIAGVWENSLE